MPDTPPDLIPDNEEARLGAIRRYDVLDTPPDGAFDRLTALAARHFDVPISIVSIVDSDRIWFKSRYGLEVEEIDRDPGLCASAILQDKPWIVEDATTDPRTLANPLVAGDFGLKFYAGVPLTTRDGHNLGTLCLIDQAPRRLTEEQTATLQDMAAIVMDQLELRLSARRVVDQELELRDHAERTTRSLQEGLLPAALPEIPGVELASLFRPADASEVGGDFYDVFELEPGRWVLVVGDVSGKGAEAAAVTALARYTIRTASLVAQEPAEVIATLNRAMWLGGDGTQPAHFVTVHLSFLERGPDGFTLLTTSAGHPPALLLRDGDHPEQVAGAGFPVGVYPDADYVTVETDVGAGDLLVIHTDGLSDARRDGHLVGEAGVISTCTDGRAATADSLITRLLDMLSEPGVTIDDDAAALVLRVL